MNPGLRRAAATLVGVWAGVLLALGAFVAPALFAALPASDAGRIAGGLFAQEASGSLVVGLAVVFVERARARRMPGPAPTFSAEVLLALAVVFCTVAGYFAVQPMMEAARAGRASVSFGLLHAVSGVFFVLRGVLLLVLAWRLNGAAGATRAVRVTRSSTTTTS